MQPKTPLFTSGSQHPPRFGHAVYLGGMMVVLLELYIGHIILIMVVGIKKYVSMAI